MNHKKLIVLYIFFALIATLGNLGAQRISLSVFEELGLIFAIGMGTLIGLIIKYILDKRWIFGDLTVGITDNSKKFALYSAMGVSTTLIFWASETLFWWIWHSDLMREIGAVLGLSVGYFMKYHLDRVFVFDRKIQ